MSREGQKQDYIDYMSVFIMQDGTPRARGAGKGELGALMFWEKSPRNGPRRITPSREKCAGCHATGVKIKTGLR